MILKAHIQSSDFVKIEIKNEILDVLVESAKQMHPNETILLLVGKIKRGEYIKVEEIMIAPFSKHGANFVSFSNVYLSII